MVGAIATVLIFGVLIGIFMTKFLNNEMKGK